MIKWKENNKCHHVEFKNIKMKKREKSKCKK